jgi:hypothetical protein
MANHQRRHSDALRYNLFQPGPQTNALEIPALFTPRTPIPRFIDAGQEVLRKQLNFAESQVADRETQYANLEAQLTEQVIESTRLKTALADLQQAHSRSQTERQALKAERQALQTECQNLQAERQAFQAERQAQEALSQTQAAEYQTVKAQVADLQRQLRALLPAPASGEWGGHRQRGRWPVQTYALPKKVALTCSRWLGLGLLGLGLIVIISWGWSALVGMGPAETMVSLALKLVGPIGTLLLGVWILVMVSEA